LIENSSIVLKDRPYLVGDLELQIGSIIISSSTKQILGRWLSNPEKLIYVNTIHIDINSVKIDFNSNQCEIMAPADLKIEIERFN